MILLKNKDKKANIKIGNNIEIKDGSDFPFDLTLYGRSTQATRSGKNLLKNTTLITETTKNGITATPNEDGSIILNGTSTDNCNFNLMNKDFGDTHFNSVTGGSTEYIASTSNSDTRARLVYDSNNKWNYLLVYGGNTLNNFVVKPMIRLASITDDTYEPYGVMPSPDYPSPIESVTEISVEVSGINSQSNSLTIDLQNNKLYSLPNGTKDEVNITNGEALLIKRVGKVVLDGSEDWAEYTSQTSDGYRVYETTKPAGPSTSFWVNNGAYSNYFKATNGFNIKNSITGTKYGIYVNIDNTITNTIATFKTWLSTHNTEVYYELAKPETINLGTVEMPHTYEGVSNITNSANTEMVVKYYKKFEFDKILRSGYNIDEQEYEIAKKQMANGKRKKILSSYVDCIIKIDLGLLDNKTYQEYKGQLEDGEYEYWSYKYNQYKKANFILTKPSITTEYAYDDDIGIDDMEITLEKSSDVS